MKNNTSLTTGTILKRQITALKQRKAKHAEKLEMLREETKNEELILSHIDKELDSLITLSTNEGEAPIGRLYLTITKPVKLRALELCVNLFLEIIEKGELSKLAEEKERVAYFWNDGFKSGHARTIQRFMGERYANEYAEISLKASFYEEKQALTDEVINEIYIYLRYLKSSFSNANKGVQFEGQLLEINGNLYKVILKGDDKKPYIVAPWNFRSKSQLLSNAMLNHIDWRVAYDNNYELLNDYGINKHSAPYEAILIKELSNSNGLYVRKKNS